MPVGVSSPASSAASLPALASDDTHTPVSSNAGLVISSVNAWPPTLPVPTCATRMGMPCSSQIGDGEIEIRVGEATVDLEGLAGQETACLRREIDGGRSDVERITEPAQRCRLLHGIAQCVVGCHDLQR